MVKPQFEVGRENLPSRRRGARPAARGPAPYGGWPTQAGELGLGVRGRRRQPAARAERQRRVLPVAARRERRRSTTADLAACCRARARHDEAGGS